VQTSTGAPTRSFLADTVSAFFSTLLRKKTEIFAEIWWKRKNQMFEKYFVGVGAHDDPFVFVLTTHINSHFI
jgi:hypothetical protein